MCHSCGGGNSGNHHPAGGTQPPAVQYKHVRPDGHTEFYDYQHQAQYWQDLHGGDITPVDRYTGQPV